MRAKERVSEGMLLITVLFVIGFLLLAVELFLIPEFGVTGLSGLFIIAISCYLMWTRLSPTWGLVSIILTTLVIGGAIWVFPHTRAARWVVLESSVSAKNGYTAAQSEIDLVGMEGTAISHLRPSGIAELADRRLDVIADGVFVERGSRVRVTKVAGSKILVELVAQSARQTRVSSAA